MTARPRPDRGLRRWLERVVFEHEPVGIVLLRDSRDHHLVARIAMTGDRRDAAFRVWVLSLQTLAARGDEQGWFELVTRGGTFSFKVVREPKKAAVAR